MVRIAARYELGPLLGAGGFAAVYRARDLTLGNDVAIKVTPILGDENFDRFRHEALALSRLKSKNIARVHDFGHDEAVGLYLVMELIDGRALDVRSLGRALLPHEVLLAARALLSALAEAHAAGIVHRDIKPSNVLVPGGLAGLADLRLFDFGIARSERRHEVQEGLGQHETQDGVLLGTPAFMAPEQISEGVVTPASDVYAAGLVLFDLLGTGPLYPGSTMQDQLAGRLQGDPNLEGRVDPVLLRLLARMLARDPRARFADAGEALDLIAELETAPVSFADLPRELSLGGPTGPIGTTQVSELETPRTPLAHSVHPATPVRLTRLPDEGERALLIALDALDLPMLEALGRRERGTDVGRVARAISLTLRLELDAAAVVLEPLLAGSPLARAVATCLVAPRARRSTRGRLETDVDETWLDEVSFDAAAVLVPLGVTLLPREDAPRVLLRCRRLLARVTDKTPSAVGAALSMARCTAASVTGDATPSVALEEFLALREAEPAPSSPLAVLVRALLLGTLTFRVDEHLARTELELAARLAAEAGITLLEVRAQVARGGLLVEIPGRVEEGLAILERAGALLAHGDAPSLEHIAQHNRGAALIIEGRYAEAAPTLERARLAAEGELSEEHEALSCMNESFAHLALGADAAARAAISGLTEAKLQRVSGRTAAYVLVARSLHALLFGEVARAESELREAHARAAQAEAAGGDAYLLAEVVAIVCAVARGESVDLLARAADLEKLAQDRGLSAFYWFDVLAAVLGHVRDPSLKAALEEALERLVLLLGPVRSGAMSTADPPPVAPSAEPGTDPSQGASPRDPVASA